ncbi:MAG TPA: nuclear transport factor 2 family protein [Candidatus Aquilonibacter sp.]
MMLSLALSIAMNGCSQSAFTGERRNTATIARLERAWTTAFLTGDERFEACLLTPEFGEIFRDGRTGTLASELALAAKNRGKPTPAMTFPPEQITIHGDVAVAYGVVRSKTDPHRATRFADYYVWEGERWRVFFAQQTGFEV